MFRDKKAIKRDILDKFRSLGEESDVLPADWLEADYMAGLNIQEKKIFKQAVRELVSSGLVEPVKGAASSLKLTQKGANLIS
jgi:hypothetical protein